MSFGKAGLRLFIMAALSLLFVSQLTVAADTAVDVENELLFVHLASFSFNPLIHDLSIAAEPSPLFLTAYPQYEAGYYIVQLKGPVKESDKRAIIRAGGELLGYIPDYAFIVRLDWAGQAAVSRLNIVRWMGIYQPAFRISPSIYQQQLFSEPPPESNHLDIRVLLFPDVNVDDLLERIKRVGGNPQAISITEWDALIELSAPPQSIPAIAAINGVSWLEAAPQWELHNEIAVGAGIMNVTPMWTTHGYTGSGQIVAISDTHLDTGDPATYIEDFLDCSGATPRVTIVQWGTIISDTHGHGTHVAGSVLGNGRLSGSSCGNFTGHPAGAAPEAEGYFQALIGPGALSGIPDNLNDLFQPAYDFGARIHTNSWGSSVQGRYTTSSLQVDQFSWDNKDFLILYAAGNDGRDISANGVIDLGSIGSPATAKNALTVGASENNRPGVQVWSGWTIPFAPILNDDRADNVNGLAAFSSRGPTDDGRTKPDIVAPGTLIRSTRSTAVTSSSGDYVLYSGTSMATPLTAGAAAVARQAFTDLETYAPSAAMLKSLLANGAADMHPGQYGIGPTQEIPVTRPSNQAGWGRVNLTGSLFPAGDRSVHWWDHGPAAQSSLNNLSTGQTMTYTFAVNSSAEPLAATLAWMDYPGTLAALGGLVNDLDITIEDPNDDLYYPNNAAQRTVSQLLDPASTWQVTLAIANGDRRATLMTPTQFPARPANAKLYFRRVSTTSPSSGSVTFNVVLYNNNGPGGAPGTVLCTIPNGRAAWGAAVANYPVDIRLDSCPDITAAIGSFFLSVEFTSDAAPDVGFRGQDNPNPAVSWGHTGASWSADPDYSYSWAAVVYQPVDPITQHDRVNNLLGIDIPSPPTGVYTMTISGHNIPFGPQPYGLTLSGDLRLLGTETVTRTIDGTGVYKFGNTGVTINFTSEDVDSVAVTVYRDRFPTDNPSDALINRSYYITTTGGTGAFNASVTFYYEDAELNAHDEDDLNLYRYDGSDWQPYSVASQDRDTAANTLTIHGVTEFSFWTIGPGPTPTAVTLQSITATAVAPLLLVMLLIVGLATVTMLVVGRRRLTA
jgi:subtilisin family serine protease